MQASSSGPTGCGANVGSSSSASSSANGSAGYFVYAMTREGLRALT